MNDLTALDIVALVFIVAGCVFYAAGSVGMLRFPDVLTRLHATTKADNLGLGLVLVGLALEFGSLLTAVKLLLIWVLVIVSSSAACHIIARAVVTRDAGREAS
jgi:multicomponent Na+:H+ antiporter subunit G